MSPEQYQQYDATGLSELVARREVSPRELLDAAIARCEAVNPSINAVCGPMFEIARERCEEALAGPFAGVPFLLKDIGHHYAGQPTTAGSRALRNFAPAEHSEYVRRCLAAGLVVFGKTTTPELALKGCTEAALYGPTRNPWALDRTPGGSSGGAASAVAARIVPMASASDGGGSIRIPSAYCGLFGLRPGRGRVPSGPYEDEVWDGASQSHVVCHSVRDSARMLDVLAGIDPGAPFVIAAPERPYAEEIDREPGRLRIGYSVRSPIGEPIDPECVRAVQAAAKLLEGLGHHVEEASPEIDGLVLARSYFTMYFGQTAATYAWALREAGADESDFELDTRALAMIGRAVDAGEYVEARRQWNVFARALGRFHARHDLYLTPTVAALPARIGEQDLPLAQRLALRALLRVDGGRLLRRSGATEAIWRQALGRVPFTQLANLTGTPAMSVPLATSADGLPVGLQFVAASGGEGLLLRLAAQLERAAPWAGRIPRL